MTLAEIESSSMAAAADAYSRRAMFNHDLNQYSTQGARGDWQKGYDGSPPPSYLMHVGWAHCLAYQLGKRVKALDILLSAEPMESFI